MESLDINTGAQALSALLDPVTETEDETEHPELIAELESSDEPAADEPEADPEEKTFTILVDGKEVQLTEAQLAESYKSGLRQSDYTKKTMEAAETRKAAEAEFTKARDEREQLAQKLRDNGLLLEAAIGEQNKIDWGSLLDSDPVEYLKQQHLYQQRQAALQQMQNEWRQIQQQNQAEQETFQKHILSEQREELLAKLPAWKDEGKAKAEKQEIVEWMKSSGYDQSVIDTLTTAKDVLTVRKAMLYDKMVGKAQAATKKVENLPKRVERAGMGTATPLDKRTAAFQKLTKSGSIEDAASVFSSFI